MVCSIDEALYVTTLGNLPRLLPCFVFRIFVLFEAGEYPILIMNYYFYRITVCQFVISAMFAYPTVAAKQDPAAWRLHTVQEQVGAKKRLSIWILLLLSEKFISKIKLLQSTANACQLVCLISTKNPKIYSLRCFILLYYLKKKQQNLMYSSHLEFWSWYWIWVFDFEELNTTG